MATEGGLSTGATLVDLVTTLVSVLISILGFHVSCK